MVIQQLPLELRDAVCVFYLVLRALDTVEDDMALPLETKLPHLRAFHEHIFDRSAPRRCCALPPLPRTKLPYRLSLFSLLSACRVKQRKSEATQPCSHCFQSLSGKLA